MFETPLINSPLGVLAVLLGVCATWFYVEKVTKWKLFGYLPPLIFIYVTPVILTNTGVITGSSPTYGSIRHMVLPMMLVLLLIKVDVRAAFLRPLQPGRVDWTPDGGRLRRHRGGDLRLRAQDVREEAVSQPEAQTLRALIRGRVQGVGFRQFVEEQAGALGLKGFVRNLSNGATVEVVAEGPMPALETLLAGLRRGPPIAYVERVDVSWAAATGDHVGFAVR